MGHFIGPPHYSSLTLSGLESRRSTVSHPVHQHSVRFASEGDWEQINAFSCVIRDMRRLFLSGSDSGPGFFLSTSGIRPRLFPFHTGKPPSCWPDMMILGGLDIWQD